MSCILKYFSFLCQLKGHDASNELVTKDFDSKFGHRNGFLEDSEALCMCPCSFGFIFFLNSKLSSKKIKYVDMGDFPPNDLFFGCVETLHQISVSQVECKWKKTVSWKDSLSILCWYPILSSALIRIWFHHQIKSSCWTYVEKILNPS